MKTIRAFTLVELLVVISIIGVLVGLLLPTVQSARESARQTQCKNNLKQLGLAAHAFHDLHGHMPKGCDWRPDGGGYWNGFQDPYINFSAFFYLLPHLEQGNLADGINTGGWWFDPENKHLATVAIPVLNCPSEVEPPIQPHDDFSQLGMTSYVSSLGTWYQWVPAYYDSPRGSDREVHNGVFWMQNSDLRFSEVTDGLSNTLMFGEQARLVQFKGFGKWFYGSESHTFFLSVFPINASFEGPIPPRNGTVAFARVHFDASSYHPGGASFCFADGSVRFLSETIDAADPSIPEVNCMIAAGGWSEDCVSPGVYQALGTRSGGEVVGDY